MIFSSLQDAELRLTWRAVAVALGLVVVSTLVASPAHAQTFNVLYYFSVTSNGQYPFANVVSDPHGTMYGTTMDGGAHGKGVVFKLDRHGNETVLHSFDGKDGKYPFAGLFRDASGNLCGTTVYGGSSGMGTVFKLDKHGTETVLHNFRGDKTDGGYPYGDLLGDGHGNLFGTTNIGGAHHYGTVFKLDRNGRESTLYSFDGGVHGGSPYSSLVADAAGNLYGTTSLFGTLGFGTVFKLDPAGNETVLYSFTGAEDGAYPYAGVVLDHEGNIYGVTTGGGLSCYYGDGCGVVFKLDRAGQETVLYSFAGGGTDGAYPYGTLVMDPKGNLYGTTLSGGDPSNPAGIVFKVDQAGNETVLHAFVWVQGAVPYAGLIHDAKGNLFGTTSLTAQTYGTVFQITP